MGLRRDIAAYRRIPPSAADVDLALLADTSGLADETDWEALYPEAENNHWRATPRRSVACPTG